MPPTTAIDKGPFVWHTEFDMGGVLDSYFAYFGEDWDVLDLYIGVASLPVTGGYRPSDWRIREWHNLNEWLRTLSDCAESATDHLDITGSRSFFCSIGWEVGRVGYLSDPTPLFNWNGWIVGGGGRLGTRGQHSLVTYLKCPCILNDIP